MVVSQRVPSRPSQMFDTLSFESPSLVSSVRTDVLLRRNNPSYVPTHKFCARSSKIDSTVLSGSPPIARYGVTLPDLYRSRPSPKVPTHRLPSRPSQTVFTRTPCVAG